MFYYTAKYKSHPTHGYPFLWKVPQNIIKNRVQFATVRIKSNFTVQLNAPQGSESASSLCSGSRPVVEMLTAKGSKRSSYIS